MIDDHPELLNVREAAAYVRCSVSFLNKRRVYGGGPVFIKRGASVLYARIALDAWLASQTRRSTSEYQQAAGAWAVVAA